MKIVSATAAVIALEGCGAQSDTAETSGSDGGAAIPAENTLKVGVTADPVTMAPWAAETQGRYGVLISVYESMFYLKNGEGEMILCPLIASGYENTDATHTVVTLRDDVYDSKGNAITADDVVFCYQQAIKAATQPFWTRVISCEKSGDWEITFTWTEDMLVSLGFFENVLTGCNIVNRAEYEASADGFAMDPVDTGPYVVDTYVSGSHVILKKNENYWWKDPDPLYCQNVDTIRIDVIIDSSQIAIGLEIGTINWSANVAQADMRLFEEGGIHADEFSVEQIMQSMNYTLRFNCDKTALGSNINFRKAILYSFDVDTLIQNLCNGAGYRVYCPVGTPNSACDYNMAWEEQDYYEYDFDKAMEYLNKFLAETNQSAGDITVRLMALVNGLTQDIAEILQTYILKLGVKCEISTMDLTNNTLMVDPSNYDVAITRTGTQGGYVLGNMALMRKDTVDPNTCGGFINDDYLEEIASVAQTREGHTQENVDKVIEYFTEQAYGYGLFTGYDNVVHEKWVVNSLCGLDNKTHYRYGAFEYDWSLM